MTNLDLVAAMREQKLLSVPAGDNVVRLMPPLNVTDAEIEEGLGAVEAACAAMAGGVTEA